MKPAEVEWRLLRAERRALDGPQFKSPVAVLARTLDRIRKLLINDAAQRKRAKRRKTDRPRILPRIHGYAIERFQKRIKELLPLVSIRELARALTKLDRADFKTAAQEQVVKAYRTIFYKTDSEPDSVEAVHDEIKAALHGKHKNSVPSLGTVYNILNRLEYPTKEGKRGPARHSRHKKKTSKKRLLTT